MTVWLTLLASGIAGYLTRALPLVVTFRGAGSDVARRYLDALPVAIIAALAGAGVALPDGTPTHGAEIVAAAVVVAVAAARRSLLLAVVAGVATVAALRALGL